MHQNLFWVMTASTQSTFNQYRGLGAELDYSKVQQNNDERGILFLSFFLQKGSKLIYGTNCVHNILGGTGEKSKTNSHFLSQIQARKHVSPILFVERINEPVAELPLHVDGPGPVVDYPVVDAPRDVACSSFSFVIKETQCQLLVFVTCPGKERAPPLGPVCKVPDWGPDWL